MNSLRQTFLKLIPTFGAGQPNWMNSNLGKATRDPQGLLSGLNLSSVHGAGSDWFQDIFNFLQAAIKSAF